MREVCFTFIRVGDTLPGMKSDALQFRRARRDESRVALGLLLSGFSEEQRGATLTDLLSELSADAAHPSGLFVGELDGQVEGVALAQLQPGRTAAVWRPRFVHEKHDSAGEKLIAHCVGWLATQNTRVSQALLETGDDAAATWFTAAGFQRVARLAYLAWEATEVAPALESARLRFEKAAVGDNRILGAIVARSYERSLDCPALDGVRPVDEVLEGYRATGRNGPELWRIAYLGEQPVGCIILAEFPDADQCELVYMGILPEVRGRGLGAELISEAQRLTTALSHARLVLAVDQANLPALALYSRAGFRPWDERDVFVQIQE